MRRWFVWQEKQRWMSLGFLLFLAADPLLLQRAEWHVWYALGLAALYMPLHFARIRGNEALLPGLVAAITLLAGVSIALDCNRSAAALFIFAANFAGTAPGRRAPALIAAVLAAAAAAFLAADMDMADRAAWALPALVLTLVVGAMRTLETQRRRGNAALERAHLEVERLAAVAERERIGRDLHDLLGHTLSMITLKSQLAARLGDRNAERATQEMREVEGISRAALRQVRDAVRGYLATSLAGELAAARKALAAADIAHDLSAEAELRLPQAQETALALVLREGVTNIVRHACATRASGSIRRDGDAVVLTLCDNGRGRIAREGNGLRGIRQRAAACGGSCCYRSDRGVSLTVRIPCAQAPEAAA